KMRAEIALLQKEAPQALQRRLQLGKLVITPQPCRQHKIKRRHHLAQETLPDLPGKLRLALCLFKGRLEEPVGDRVELARTKGVGSARRERLNPPRRQRALIDLFQILRYQGTHRRQLTRIARQLPPGFAHRSGRTADKHLFNRPPDRKLWQRMGGDSFGEAWIVHTVLSGDVACGSRGSGHQPAQAQGPSVHTKQTWCLTRFVQAFWGQRLDGYAALCCPNRRGKVQAISPSGTPSGNTSAMAWLICSI